MLGPGISFFAASVNQRGGGWHNPGHARCLLLVRSRLAQRLEASLLLVRPGEGRQRRDQQGPVSISLVAQLNRDEMLQVQQLVRDWYGSTVLPRHGRCRRHALKTRLLSNPARRRLD